MGHYASEIGPNDDFLRGKVTEPTPKPTDALEELKRVARALEEYEGSPGDFWAELEGAIAAWEKERAERGRVEEKKAAFLEAARVWLGALLDYRDTEHEAPLGGAQLMFENLARLENEAITAYCSLVENEKVGESASKKEDAPE